MQTVQDKSGSGVVTLPKEDLEGDGYLDEGDIPEDQNVLVERLGEGAFVVRLCDGGEIPELTETEIVQRLAAQRAERIHVQDPQDRPKSAD